MTGYYQFKETAPASPQIPIIAYWMITIKGRLPFRMSTTTWKDKTQSITAIL